MANEPTKPDRDWTEELTVTGQELVERIKKLVAEGNVRRLIIRKPDGESLLVVPEDRPFNKARELIVVQNWFREFGGE